VNEHELEQLARQLGARAAERLDVETAARAVVERLRQPIEEKKRVTWTRPEWLRIAAALAVLLGAGVVLQEIQTGQAPAGYVMEDLSDLTAAELSAVLRDLDQTLDGDLTDEPAVDLENLTPAQLQALLRDFET
jgi:hypothetical protein